MQASSSIVDIILTTLHYTAFSLCHAADMYRSETRLYAAVRETVAVFFRLQLCQILTDSSHFCTAVIVHKFSISRIHSKTFHLTLNMYALYLIGKRLVNVWHGMYVCGIWLSAK